MPKGHCIWKELRAVTKSGRKITAVKRIDELLSEQYFNKLSWKWAESEDVARASAPDGEVIKKERRIHGWIGIQRFFSKEHYGIDFIRNGRVIEQLSKDLFYVQNPNTLENELEYPIDTTHWGGRIVGEIHCDFVPLSDFKKTSFEKAHKNWHDVLGLIRGGNSPLRPEIGKRWDMPPNYSPLAQLYQGYRKGNPPGSANLVPGGRDGKGDNTKATEWAQKFWDGEKDFQEDTKWWEAVQVVDKARRSTRSKDENLEAGDLSDPFNDEIPEAEPETPTFEMDLFLSKKYMIEGANTQAIEVKAFVDDSIKKIKDLERKAPLISDPIKKGVMSVYYNPRHPVFTSFSQEPIDYLLLELSI